MAEQSDALQRDLSELLTLLGMGDHARLQSPHEVFQECLAVLRKRLAPPEANPAGEALYRVAVEQSLASLAPEDRKAASLGEALRFCERWMPEALPANDAGQVPFARVLFEQALDAIRAHLASPPGAVAKREEKKAEEYIAAAISRAPEPLRRLGEYLAQVLDEDEFKTAEPMLLGVAEANGQPGAVAQEGQEGDGQTQEALKQALDRLQRVQRVRDGELLPLPQVEAAIALIEKVLSRASTDAERRA